MTTYRVLLRFEADSDDDADEAASQAAAAVLSLGMGAVSTTAPQHDLEATE